MLSRPRPSATYSEPKQTKTQRSPWQSCCCHLGHISRGACPMFDSWLSAALAGSHLACKPFEPRQKSNKQSRHPLSCHRDIVDTSLPSRMPSSHDPPGKGKSIRIFCSDTGEKQSLGHLQRSNRSALPAAGSHSGARPLGLGQPGPGPGGGDESSIRATCSGKLIVCRT